MYEFVINDVYISTYICLKFLICKIFRHVEFDFNQRTCIYMFKLK